MTFWFTLKVTWLKRLKVSRQPVFWTFYFLNFIVDNFWTLFVFILFEWFLLNIAKNLKTAELKIDQLKQEININQTKIQWKLKIR